VLLFVYGTLKRGCGNHYLIREVEGRFIKSAMVFGYTLITEIIPYMFKSLPDCQVLGELYEIPDTKIHVIDVLEGNPRWYLRSKVIAYLDHYKLVGSRGIHYSRENL
jgi:gamma-glutamylaminecyclotransferase